MPDILKFRILSEIHGLLNSGPNYFVLGRKKKQGPQSLKSLPIPTISKISSEIHGPLNSGQDPIILC